MEKRGQIPLELIEEESPRKVNAKKKALERSIHEGVAANLSISLGNSYITPFALALKANPLHIGFLSSFAGLLSPLTQIFGNRLMEKRSRKTIVMKFVLLQSLMWLPIALLGILYWKGILQNYLPWALIILYTLVVSLGGVALPAWFSWMGDLVPESERARYFAKRTRATTAIGIAAALIAAFILDAFKTKGLALIGFTILFVTAFTFRLLSFLLFKKQYSPKFKLKKRSRFSFLSFIKKYDNYGKYSFYQAFFMLSSMIAGPFFAVYMLKNLGFSYITFMIVSMSASVFYLIFAPLAGKFGDKYGSKKLITIGSIIFIFTPIFWIFLKTPLSLILIPQLLAGLANATIMIGFTKFTYDAVTPQHRGICLAYTNILIGIGTFIGAILGGLIVKNIAIGTISPFFIAFGVASFMRFASSAYFLPKIKEITHVKKVPKFNIDLTHPLRTLHSEVIWFKALFR